jgi:hypothetical protein
MNFLIDTFSCSDCYMRFILKMNMDQSHDASFFYYEEIISYKQYLFFKKFMITEINADNLQSNSFYNRNFIF